MQNKTNIQKTTFLKTKLLYYWYIIKLIIMLLNKRKIL